LRQERLARLPHLATKKKKKKKTATEARVIRLEIL
jgi:hypothetical protein